MPHARAEIGIAHYAVTIDASGHRIVSDEPLAALRSAQADWSAAVKNNSAAGDMQIQEETR